MKKLLMITVVLALVSGAAFAQVSGDFFAMTELFGGNTEQKDADGNLTFNMGGTPATHWDRLGSKWGIRFGEGAASGRIVFRLHDASLWGWFSWRPVEQFRLKYGWDRDGEWGAAQINGWGFVAGAKDTVAYNEYKGPALNRVGAMRGWAWYPGIGDGAGWSLMASIYPVDGLAINLGLPGKYDPPKYAPNAGAGADTGLNWSKEASLQLSLFHININYKIEEVGLVNFAFVGDGGLGKDREKLASPGTLYASFFLTALKEQGIGEFDLGFAFHTPFKNASDQDMDGQMQIGLGYRLGIEAFQFKLRAGAHIGGKNAGADMPTLIGVGILPQYKFSALTFYFHAGFGMSMPKEGDSTNTWFINPYISVPIGGANFWVGLNVWQDVKPAAGPHATYFSIPIGFNANY